MTTKTRRSTRDAVEILRRRYVAGNPEAEALLDGLRAGAELARTLYQLRIEAGLTQQALAERVGTTASVISRLEDDDYKGHSLAMLRRIARALGRRIEIRFPALKTTPRAAAEARKKAGESRGDSPTVKPGRAGGRKSSKPGASLKRRETSGDR